MNLKEAFRYQKFLDTLMAAAGSSVMNAEHALKSTKTHFRKAADPAVEDEVEQIDVGEFVSNDLMLSFMSYMVEQKEALSVAIGRAKASIGFDIDAAIEANKFRQSLNSSIKRMLAYTVGKRKSVETGYRFDVNGQQVPYRYNVEIVTTENYDKASAKAMMRDAITKADEVSAAIDAAMINTVVDYTPPYGVNESFDDVLESFIKTLDVPPAE